MSDPTGRPLFVYGSLRDPAVRVSLLGDRPDVEARAATLRGFARLRSVSFEYPFVAPAGPADAVDGDLLFGLSPADFAVLDAYEDVGAGLYVRLAVVVDAPDGPVEAWVYARGPNAPD